jgi:dihydroneopterin aldolase / 2-amino-4-hydroxy-6-hydroxymethyldihydropteridine diphosphokinase
MAVVYLGIGSNLGNKSSNCRRSVKLLRDRGITVTKESVQFITEPWGLKDQPGFCNMAVEAFTELPPLELLAVLKDIEREMGRESGVRWGPRIIDLDILLYDNLIFSDDMLTIPHPHLHERRFALEPLSEIAPDVLHPVMLKTIESLLREVSHDKDNNR